LKGFVHLIRDFINTIGQKPTFACPRYDLPFFFSGAFASSRAA